MNLEALKKLRDVSRAFPILSLIILCGYLFAWNLQDYYFTQDHAYHLIFADRIKLNFLEHIKEDTHPPLYYFLVRGVIEVVGVDHPLILRGVSLIAGLFSVLLCFFWGSSLSGDKKVGWLSAFLVATSPLFILQSQVIRNYSLLICLLLIFFILLTKKYFAERDLVIAIFLSFLLTLTHYSSVMFLPTFLILGLVRLRSSQKLKVERRLGFESCWVVAMVLNGLLTLWMASQRPESFRSDQHILGLKKQVAGQLLNLKPVLSLLIGSIFGEKEAFLVWMLMGFGFLFLVVDRRKDLLLLFGGPFLTGIVMSLANKYPLTTERHSIYLLPVFLIPVIWLLNRLARKSPIYLLIVFFLIIRAQRGVWPGIYRLDKWRKIQEWEVGPRFSEMNLVKEHLKNDNPRGPLLLDWDLGFSWNMEKRLSPHWAIFLNLERPITQCNMLLGIENRDPCHCFSKKANTTEITNLLVLNGQEQPLQELSKKYTCFRILNKKQISENYSLFDLRAQ